MAVKLKKFIVVPNDGFRLLQERHGSLEDATEAAEAMCLELDQGMTVVEMKATVARETPPVKVRKIR